MPVISERVASMVRMTMADMADLADAHPDAYRLENADAVIPPAAHVLEATRAAVGDDRHNSYLPLRGLPELREAIAHRLREDYGPSGLASRALFSPSPTWTRRADGVSTRRASGRRAGARR